MQTVIFIISAVVIYLLTAQILKVIETNRSEPLPNRQIIFFIIFFALILLSFELLKLFFATQA
jgi:uncharacterized membrane protein YecN with MAPEG domain